MSGGKKKKKKDMDEKRYRKLSGCEYQLQRNESEWEDTQLHLNKS